MILDSAAFSECAASAPDGLNLHASASFVDTHDASSQHAESICRLENELSMVVNDNEQALRSYVNHVDQVVRSLCSKVEKQDAEIALLRSDLVFSEERLRFSAEQLRTVSLYLQALDAQQTDSRDSPVTPEGLTRSLCDMSAISGLARSHRHPGSLLALRGAISRARDDLDLPVRARRYAESLPSAPSSLSGGDTPILSGIGDGPALRNTYALIMNGLQRLFHVSGATSVPAGTQGRPPGHPGLTPQ